MAATKIKLESIMIQLAAEVIYPKVRNLDADCRVKTVEHVDNVNDCTFYVDFIHNEDSIDIVGASVLIDGVEDEGLSFDLKHVVDSMVDNKGVAYLCNQEKQIINEHQYC